jgi:FSR family fosmidomycin resistance protein-like MFS transporter
VGVAGLYLGGYLADRFGIFAISIASLVLTVPALAAFFVLHGVGAVAMLLLGGVLLNVQSAPSVTIVQRMLPRNLGMALGLINGVAFGIGSAMVTAIGYFVARFGAQQALFDVAFLPIACAAVYGVVALREGQATTRRQTVLDSTPV